MQTEKIIIIGGGPAGLAAAIYNARANLNPLVIEGSPPGGQLTITSDVENYPGFPKGILGPQLIQEFRAQAERFNTRFVSSNVLKLDLSARPFKIVMADGETEYTTESILIATGAQALWLNLESETRLRGKGVSACATCDGFFFKNKTVAIIGGGDTAMEEALTLTHFASKVYVIHRRDSFKASQIMQKRVLENPKVEVIWNASVEEVLGEQKVEGVKLSTGKTLELQGLFIAIGHKPTTDFLKESGIKIDAQGYIMTSARYAWEKMNNVTQEELKFNSYYQYTTNIEGVFAAGDVIDPHYRQAGTAVGMGVAAALEVEKYLQGVK